MSPTALQRAVRAGVAGLPAETSTRPLRRLGAKKNIYCVVLILSFSRFRGSKFAPLGSDALALCGVGGPFCRCSRCPISGFVCHSLFYPNLEVVTGIRPTGHVAGHCGYNGEGRGEQPGTGERTSRSQMAGAGGPERSVRHVRHSECLRRRQGAPKST